MNETILFGVAIVALIVWIAWCSYMIGKIKGIDEAMDIYNKWRGL